MPKNVKQRKPKAKPVAEIPRELTVTPKQNSYAIMMMDEVEGADVEQVEVSREEYLAIKKLLIKMRGYAAPETAHA